MLGYFSVVPQKSFNETIPLKEPEILSGQNGRILNYSYNGLDDPYIDYSFHENNYTTGDLKKGFIWPSSIEKDGRQAFIFVMPRVVGDYFNDSRFLSFQFYFDRNVRDDGYYHLGFMKGVGNEKEFHYQLDYGDDVDYGKFGYGASCQISPDGRAAFVTYFPDGRCGGVIGTMIVIICAILYLAIDNRLFP